MASLAEPTLEKLYDDLYVLQHADPGARRAGMTTNSYAVLSDDSAVYIDVGSESLRPLVNQVTEMGYTPAALLLSHRHVATSSDTLLMFARKFGVPVFLHPVDARNPQAAQSGIEFVDPIENDLLRQFDLEARFFPGHTEGHIVNYWDQHGGVLFTGDAAMGTTIEQDQNGTEHLVRPPIRMTVNDDALRQGWANFDDHLNGVAPYHGTIYLDRADSMTDLMRPLQRSEPTRAPTE